MKSDYNYLFNIVEKDITSCNADIIVNAANNRLLPGGGVCGAVFKAAGKDLEEACSVLDYCATGAVQVTAPFNLSDRFKYIFHTVGPVWSNNEEETVKLLSACYRNCLEKAIELSCSSIVFPLLSSGIYMVPFDIALRTAATSILSFLNANNDKFTEKFTVTLCLFNIAGNNNHENKNH